MINNFGTNLAYLIWISKSHNQFWDGVAKLLHEGDALLVGTEREEGGVGGKVGERKRRNKFIKFYTNSSCKVTFIVI